MLCCINVDANDVIIVEPGSVVWHSGNENYTVNGSMNFSKIILGDKYIFFNTTGFYITSVNGINITLFFINGSMTGSVWDNLLNFSANTSGGNVWFNISGFSSGSNYSVNRSGIFYDNMSANASGYISFNNSVWPGSMWYWDVFLYEIGISGLLNYIYSNGIPLLLCFSLFGIPLFIIFYKRKKEKI